MKKISILIAALLLTSCANTSEGVKLGRQGSPIWNKNAPASDIISYYDKMKTYELCMTWDKAMSKAYTLEIRRNIAEALLRRGEPEGRCYNQARDAAVMNAEVSRRSQSSPVMVQQNQSPRIIVQQPIDTSPRHVSCRTIGKTTHCF